jgi:hypothetical protein
MLGYACFARGVQLQDCNKPTFMSVKVAEPLSRLYFACAVMILSAKAENTPANR